MAVVGDVGVCGLAVQHRETLPRMMMMCSQAMLVPGVAGGTTMKMGRLLWAEEEGHVETSPPVSDEQKRCGQGWTTAAFA